MPEATFYLWSKIPSKKFKNNSLKFTSMVLEKTGVMATPGVGFGNFGEGFIRFAAIPSLKDIQVALARLSII
jgi:LL-diaminopimelate aminotransferase